MVPVATSEWKPEIAPQAMVMKTKGKSGPGMIGPPPASYCVNAGICRVGWTINTPAISAKIVPIFKSKAEAKHGPAVIPKWGGDAVGWYEGDTLVIETVNSNPNQRSYISKAGKVTERFTRWSADQIFYQFTVEDPTLYKQTWGGEMSLNTSKEPLYEYACHEGNYALPGILAGARAVERKAVKDAGR